MKRLVNTKKIVSVLLMAVMMLSICLPAGRIDANAVTGPVIKSTVSGKSFKKGDVITVKFSFEDFKSYDIDMTTFQLDVSLDTEIFEFVSAMCHLESKDTLASTTVFNKKENVVRTVYINMKAGSSITDDTADICSFDIKLIKDYGEDAVDYKLPIGQVVVMDGNAQPNITYDCKVEAPSFKLVGSSYNQAGETNAPETVAPETAAPETNSPESEKPENDKPATDVPVTDATSKPTETNKPLQTPEVTPEIAPTYTVTYCDEYGRVFNKETVKKGQKAPVQVTPYRLGYKFIGWALSGGSLENVTENITAIPLFEVKETLYNISAEGGTLHNGETSGKFMFDECVVVSVDESKIPDGKVFAGWEKEDGTVVSYSKTYSFLVTESVNLKAVYTEKEVEALPLISLEAIKTDHTSFVAERNCPEGYSYVSSGVLLTTDRNVALDDKTFTKDAQGVSVITSSVAAVNGKLCVTNEAVYEKLYARAYLVYADSQGNETVIYSEIKTSF
ncbi:MAG: InlB B-repeat-containing protein [Clostridia bacterium]|nr:InlB B-repeat-containing protein [Clostridia bacterium]